MCLHKNVKMEIVYSKQAIKFLSKQNIFVRERIINAVKRIPNGDIKKLQGRSGYRLRIGKYRVIFDNDGRIILIEKIDNRGDVYK